MGWCISDVPCVDVLCVKSILIYRRVDSVVGDARCHFTSWHKSLVLVAQVNKFLKIIIGVVFFPLFLISGVALGLTSFVFLIEISLAAAIGSLTAIVLIFLGGSWWIWNTLKWGEEDL